jgi:hypothetical protein
MWYIDINVSEQLLPPPSGHFKQNRQVKFSEMLKIMYEYTQPRPHIQGSWIVSTGNLYIIE